MHFLFTSSNNLITNFRQSSKLLSNITAATPFFVVEIKRFELLTPCLQSRCSSQLSYTPILKWWAWEDSNFRPHAYQACALTT